MEINTENNKKQYLGDGVYSNFERGAIVLTTENGIETTNEIILEPEVILAFVGYMKSLGFDPCLMKT